MNKATAVIFIIIPVILSSCASSHKEAPAQLALYESNDKASSRSYKGVADSRMVAYTISLALTVKNTDETKNILLQSVKNCNGYVVQESENYIAARVPQENAERFIHTSKALGKTVSESKTGTDITDQYRDNVIRLDNFKNVRQRYLALLERADSVHEVLSIEKELQRVELEIEVLEGRIKHSEQSVAYSYVTVRFREKTRPGPVGWVFYGLYHGVKLLFVW
jgi:5-methylcytosine-specific restriction endonuclease McrA